MPFPRPIAVLVAGLSMLATPLASAQAGSDPASRLVAAMGADYSAVLGMQLSVKRGAEEGRVSGSTVDCVNNLDRTSFTPVLAQLVTRALSVREIAAATQFFESALGRKYVQHGIAQLYQAVGAVAPDPTPNFSDAELRSITAFSRSSAGDKIMVKRVFEAPAARETIVAKVQELLKSCRQG